MRCVMVEVQLLEDGSHVETPCSQEAQWQVSDAHKSAVCSLCLARILLQGQGLTAREISLPVLELKEVQPIGEKTTPCFGHLNDEARTPVYSMQVPVYPENSRAKAFKRQVREMKLGMREIARRLGVQPVQIYGLENGRFECDWDLADRLLRTEDGHDTHGKLSE